MGSAECVLFPGFISEKHQRSSATEPSHFSFFLSFFPAIILFVIRNKNSKLAFFLFLPLHCGEDQNPLLLWIEIPIIPGVTGLFFYLFLLLFLLLRVKIDPQQLIGRRHRSHFLFIFLFPIGFRFSLKYPR